MSAGRRWRWGQALRALARTSGCCRPGLLCSKLAPSGGGQHERARTHPRRGPRHARLSAPDVVRPVVATPGGTGLRTTGRVRWSACSEAVAKVDASSGHAAGVDATGAQYQQTAPGRRRSRVGAHARPTTVTTSTDLRPAQSAPGARATDETSAALDGAGKLDRLTSVVPMLVPAGRPTRSATDAASNPGDQSKVGRAGGEGHGTRLGRHVHRDHRQVPYRPRRSPWPTRPISAGGIESGQLSAPIPTTRRGAERSHVSRGARWAVSATPATLSR